MRKIIISFLCVMMLGITGCSSGGDGSKTQKKHNKDVVKQNSTNSKEKKDLKEMVPDPNNMLDGDAIIGFEYYEEESHTYNYKIDKLIDDSFYKKYVEACKNSGNYGGFSSENVIGADDNDFVYKAYSEDKKFWVNVFYYSEDEDHDWVRIYSGVETENLDN